MTRIVSILLLTLPLSGFAGVSSEPLEPVTRLSGHPDWVTAVAFAPSGESLFVAGYDYLYAYDTDNWEKTPLTDGIGAVGSMAVSPDGRTLAVGAYQKILLFSLTDGPVVQAKRELRGHRGLVSDVTFVSDGRLASASQDETVCLWDLPAGEKQHTIKLGEPVQGIAVHGALLATASGDIDRPTRPGRVRLWQLGDGQAAGELDEHARAATGVCFDASGLLVSTGLDEKAFVHNPEKPDVPATVFAEHARPVQGVVCLQNNMAATISGGGATGKNELILWNTSTRETLAKLEPHKAPVTALARSADAQLLATGSRDKTVGVFAVKPAKPKVIRIGMIGLDTSHCGAFTKVLNDENAPEDVAGCRVVCAYPFGSRDIKSSASRIPKYTEDMKKLGVEITDSIDDLLSQVDVVLLETNDGRLHLEQYLACAKAGKPVFIDKPVAAQLDDVVAIYAISKWYKTPMFSSSSLRYSTGALEARAGKVGRVLGCDTYGPCSFEKTHSDLYWYGIHGVELLFTAMGTGCQSVSSTSTPMAEHVTGVWDGGRVGTFRGIRSGKTGYGGSAFGEKGIRATDGYQSYRPLVVEIVSFFKTGKPPIDPQETMEIYAFMSAAAESKKRGGAAVTIDSVMEAATTSAIKKLHALGVQQ